MNISDFSKIKADKNTIVNVLSEAEIKSITTTFLSDSREDEQSIAIRIKMPWKYSSATELSRTNSIVGSAATKAISKRIAELTSELIALATAAAEEAFIQVAKECQKEAIEILAIANATEGQP